jgi:hypothetical protein
MAFRRTLYGSPPPLLAALPRLRNDLLASRARLACEEAKAVERVDQLRSIMDDMSNELAQRPIDPVRTAALIVRAGDAARSGAPVKLPPKGSAARLIIDCGDISRGRKLPESKS